jgi:hypothetical protein
MELHLLMGIVKRLLDELDNQLRQIPRCHLRSDAWISQIGVTRCARGQLTGNSCSRLLDNLDSLDQMLQWNSLFPAMPVLFSLKCLREVKNCCFGLHMRGDPVSAIQKFKRSYLDLSILATPKVHVVFEHVVQFLEAHNEATPNSQGDARGNRGLGWWSEQACEAAHGNFANFWQQGRNLSMRHQVNMTQGII